MQQCIVCVAVFGPDNSPLFIEKRLDDSNSLKLESLLYSALFQTRPPTKQNDFSGCIQKADQYQIWGYQASLKYRLLIITKEVQGALMPPSRVKDFCEKVRDCVFDAILNPFYSPFSPFTSVRFKSQINDLIPTLQPITSNS